MHLTLGFREFTRKHATVQMPMHPVFMNPFVHRTYINTSAHMETSNNCNLGPVHMHDAPYRYICCLMYIGAGYLQINVVWVQNASTSCSVVRHTNRSIPSRRPSASTLQYRLGQAFSMVLFWWRSNTCSHRKNTVGISFKDKAVLNMPMVTSMPCCNSSFFCVDN